MAAARQVLERSTMMLLTSSKTCLRHPECPSARENRDTVFCQMRRAMDLIHYVVKDGVLDCSESQSYSNSQVRRILMFPFLAEYLTYMKILSAVQIHNDYLPN